MLQFRPIQRGSIVALTTLSALGALIVSGCGGGGGSSAFGPYVGRYVATLTSNAPAGDPSPEKAVVSFEVKSDGTIDATVSSYAMAQNFKATGRLSETGSISQPVTGTLTGGGLTFAFNGNVAQVGGDVTGSGTWSYTNGAGAVKSGTWTGGKAPAAHNAVGTWTGTYTMANGSTGEFVILIDAAGEVTGQIGETGPATRVHKESHIGQLDPRTGQIVFNDLPFSPSGTVQADVAKAIQGTIDMIAVDAWAVAQAREVRTANLAEITRGVVTAAFSAPGSNVTVNLIADPALTGTLQSSLTGTPTFGNLTSPLQVGDDQTNRKQQVFVTYSFDGISPSASIVSASLQVNQTGVEGDPFSGTSIFLEPVTFTTSPSAFGTGFPTGEARDVFTSGSLGARTINVTQIVQDAWHASRPTFQVRLRRIPDTDDDGVTDRSTMTAGRLTIVYR